MAVDVGLSIVVVAGVVGAGVNSSKETCMSSLVRAGISFKTGGGLGSVLHVEVRIGAGQTCGTVAKEVEV